MIERQGTWMDVSVGTYIRDKAGQVWRVERELNGHYELIGPDGRHGMVRITDAWQAVPILEPTPAEAQATVERLLDATTGGIA